MAKPQESEKPPEPASMNDFEQAFARYDANGDGKISASDLANGMRALGFEESDEELKAIMAELDSDGDGFVDLNDFAAFHSGLGDVAGGERELRGFFAMFDLDKNGRISAEELHLVLKRLGEKCSVQDCAQMIRSVDSDGDGSVNFEEFKKMIGNGGGWKASDGSGSPWPSPSFK